MLGYLVVIGSTLSHMVINSWSMYLAPKYPYPVSSSRSLPVKEQYQEFTDVSDIIEVYSNPAECFFAKKVSKKTLRHRCSLDGAVIIRFTVQKYYFSVDYTNKCYFWKLKLSNLNSIMSIKYEY